MSLPREAVGLLRGVLGRPDDETPRLVLADWLDERGTADAAAWAEYIRVSTVTHVGAMMPVERRLRVTAIGEQVKARLELPVRTFLKHCPTWVSLLPASNFDIKLADFTPPRAVLHHDSSWHWGGGHRITVVPIDWSGYRPAGRPPRWHQRTTIAVSPDPHRLARESAFLAEQMTLGHLYCATTSADEFAELAARSQRALADEAEVLRVAFGPGTGWDIEGIAAEDRPPDTIEPVAWLAHRLLDDALRDRGRAVQFRPIDRLVQIRVQRPSQWDDWRAVSPQVYVGVLAEYRRASDVGEFGSGMLRADLSGRTVELAIEIIDTPAGPSVWVGLPHRLGERT